MARFIWRESLPFTPVLLDLDGVVRCQVPVCFLLRWAFGSLFDVLEVLICRNGRK